MWWSGSLLSLLHPAKKSKVEKELGFDIDSSFGQTVAMSGGKRTMRANMKYSETEFTGGEDPTSKDGEEPNMAANPDPTWGKTSRTQLQFSPPTQ